jgi:hypothetical protein
MITITPKDKPTEPAGFSGNGIGFHISFTTKVQNAKSATTSAEINIIPDSFLRGLSDCENGRIVDMDRAMDEKPPENN